MLNVKKHCCYTITSTHTHSSHHTFTSISTIVRTVVMSGDAFHLNTIMLSCFNRLFSSFFLRGSGQTAIRKEGCSLACHHHAPPVTNRLQCSARCPAVRRKKMGFGWTLRWAHTASLRLKSVIASNHCRFILWRAAWTKKYYILHLSKICGSVKRHVTPCKMFEPQAMSPRNT